MPVSPVHPLPDNERLTIEASIKLIYLEIASIFCHLISLGIIVFSMYVGITYSKYEAFERFFSTFFDFIHGISLLACFISVSYISHIHFLAEQRQAFFRIIYTFFSLMFKGIFCIKYGYDKYTIICLFLCMFHYLSIFTSSKIEEYISMRFGPEILIRVQNLARVSPIEMNDEKFELEIVINKLYIHECDTCKGLEEEYAKDCKECICSICLDTMNNKETAKLECNHFLHTECFKEYIKTKNNCPICRKSLLRQ